MEWVHGCHSVSGGDDRFRCIQNVEVRDYMTITIRNLFDH